MTETFFENMVEKTAKKSRLKLSEHFIQHGDTSCLLHSIAVAYYSYRIASKLRFIKFHKNELIRGALLHDYFLYDWHEDSPKDKLHGFSHPMQAYKNAQQDFKLTGIEADIITKHMFPLTLIPPHCYESTIVCLVDKACSIYESFAKKAYKNSEIQYSLKLVVNE